MVILQKKIFQSLLILLPSFGINFFTLSLMDLDDNLSNFSTILVLLFNTVNFFLSYIFYKNSFKVFVIFTCYCSFLFLIFDFTLEKIINKNSITKDDKNLGWILKKDKKITFDQQTFKGAYYTVNYRSSKIDGFREFGEINSKKRVLVFGDSYTAGAYSSNEKMYYNIAKNLFEEQNLIYEWFVAGGSGYGTLQQYLFLKENLSKVKPHIIIHQFCINDFYDNDIKIGSLSTTQNQYLRRPYLINGEIKKVSGIIAKTYRFFFKYSFIFKKFDQLYTYRNITKHGRYTKKIDVELINEAIDNTKSLIYKIRDLVGPEILYFSINCADKNNNYLAEYWQNIIYDINGYPIIEPSEVIIKMKDEGHDVNQEDGGHLNDYGNEIYGKLLAKEMIRILKKIYE